MFFIYKIIFGVVKIFSYYNSNKVGQKGKKTKTKTKSRDFFNCVFGKQLHLAS